MERVFSFQADWHQQDRARPIVRQYHTTLDSVLELEPDLRRLLVHCAHCEIAFLTHPRCAGRRDLRCPFGCRSQHRRQQSHGRSAAYYRSEPGKAKKKRLNARRSLPTDERRCPTTPAVPEAPTPETPAPAPCPSPDDGFLGPIELRLGEVVLQSSSLLTTSMCGYVRILIHLIDGIHFGVTELVRHLQRTMRQHSIAFRNRTDYVLGFLHQHPP